VKGPNERSVRHSYKKSAVGRRLFSVPPTHHILDPEAESSKVHQSTDILLQHYMVPEPRRPQLESSLLLKPQILHSRL